MADRERQVRTVAGRQHGVFSRSQALTAGFTPTEIQRRRANGTWTTLHHGVYAIGGSPDTWERRTMAAVLAAGEGAAVSHLAAAWIWRIVERPPRKIDITVPYGVKSGGAHRTRYFGRNEIRRVHGIPVTSAARTIIDLAGVLSSRHLESVFDDALKRALVTTASVQRAIGTRNRRGTAVLRKLVSDRQGGVPESELERAFERLVRSASLPTPARQHRVGNRRIDFAYVEQRIAIELDGRKDHSTKTSFEQDRRRQNDLVLDGWTVLRFTWDDVTKRADYVVTHVRRALCAGGGI